MYSEDSLLPISALQHFLFCRRQCALIHTEQSWYENRLTIEGKILHENVHTQGAKNRKGVRIETGLYVRSMNLGITGIADVVEFHKEDSGILRPFPIEYKRGTSKKANPDRVQLCAQALCLEEMLNIEILQGALFYGKTKKREIVIFNQELRTETEVNCKRLHEMIDSGKTPKPVYMPGCKNCSFFSECMPKAMNRSVKDYIEKIIDEKIS